LRADEIFSLKWNSVGLVQNSVKVFDSKGEDRIVFLTGRTVDMLQGLPNDGLVFKSRTGEKIAEISNSFDRELLTLKLRLYGREPYPNWLFGTSANISISYYMGPEVLSSARFSPP